MGLNPTFLAHLGLAVKTSLTEEGKNITSLGKGGEDGRGAGYAENKGAVGFSGEQQIPRLPTVPQQHVKRFAATSQARTVKA